jgi:hypothetical protein
VPFGRPPLSRPTCGPERTSPAGTSGRPAGMTPTRSRCAPTRWSRSTPPRTGWSSARAGTGPPPAPAGHGRRQPAVAGSRGRVARDLLPADGGRRRRGQAPGRGGTARGGGGHGVARRRGGGLPDPARVRVTAVFPAPGPAGTGPWHPARRPGRQGAPRQRRPAARRSAGRRVAGAERPAAVVLADGERVASDFAVRGSCRTARSSASTWSPAWSRRRSGSTAAAIPSGSPTRRWRPAPAWCPPRPPRPRPAHRRARRPPVADAVTRSVPPSAQPGPALENKRMFTGDGKMGPWSRLAGCPASGGWPTRSDPAAAYLRRESWPSTTSRPAPGYATAQTRGHAGLRRGGGAGTPHHTSIVTGTRWRLGVVGA